MGPWVVGNVETNKEEKRLETCAEDQETFHGFENIIDINPEAELGGETERKKIRLDSIFLELSEAESDGEELQNLRKESKFSTEIPNDAAPTKQVEQGEENGVEKENEVETKERKVIEVDSRSTKIEDINPEAKLGEEKERKKKNIPKSEAGSGQIQATVYFCCPFDLEYIQSKLPRPLRKEGTIFFWVSIIISFF